MNDTRPTVVLVQPQMGLSGEFSQHLPLSLLYVAAPLKKLGVRVEILDTRVIEQDWRIRLSELLTTNPLWVGFTVMAGFPTAHALEISRFVKKGASIPVVWGGAMPTVDARSCLNDPAIDFAVAGSGIAATTMLTEAIMDGRTSDIEYLQTIPGLAFKVNGQHFLNQRFHGFEHVSYPELPYEIIKDYSVYGQIGSNERIFPVYSAYGCPYRCAFCISPALYRDFSPKWAPVDASETVDHIDYLQRHQGATTIYFYDDDSFVNLEHIRTIVTELKRRGIKIRLSFRGARVDEIKRMDDSFLELLSETGTEMLHVGVESGCQRVLDLFQKGITVEDIIEINRKLARHPKLIAAYNWIVGTPTETVSEIHQTTRLLMQLIKENPRCFIFQPNIFRVVPGSVLGEMAKTMGYKSPETLDEWINSEIEQDIASPWLSAELKQYIRMLQVTGYFVDNKASLLLKSGALKDTIIKFASKIYQPFARFRFKSGYSGMLFEAELFFLAQKMLKRWR
ncbi:MAG TPA: radical SAM protein [Candidatus Rifleibacterium sp.]|nr:radical SAM protein [Candidatus Rifleibacterium sp.]